MLPWGPQPHLGEPLYVHCRLVLGGSMLMKLWRFSSQHRSLWTGCKFSWFLTIKSWRGNFIYGSFTIKGIWNPFYFITLQPTALSWPHRVFPIWSSSAPLPLFRTWTPCPVSPINSPLRLSWLWDFLVSVFDRPLGASMWVSVNTPCWENPLPTLCLGETAL